MIDLYSHWRSRLRESEDGRLLSVVFDCDKTLINGDIGEAALRSAVEQRWVISHDDWWAHLSAGLASPAELSRWRDHYEREARTPAVRPSESLSLELWEAYEALCQSDVTSAYVYAARIAYQRSPVELALFSYAALQQDPEVSERAEMREVVRRFSGMNAEVWIVSSSHVDIVRVIAAQYGLDSQRVIGIDFERDSLSQCYTERLIIPTPIGAQKVDALSRFSDTQPALMVGDSRHDLPMMEYAEAAILIDHKESIELSESAKRIGALLFDASLLSAE